MEGNSKCEFGKRGFENADVFIDDMLHCTGREDRGVTRVHRELKSNVSECKVISSWHNEAEVAMAATATRGRDGASVSVDFLGEELERGVGGGADDGSQAGMRKGQRS